MTMPRFEFWPFVDYAVGYVSTHPIAYGLIVCIAILLCAKLLSKAIEADVERRRRQDAQARRTAALAQMEHEIQQRRRLRALSGGRAQERGR